MLSIKWKVNGIEIFSKGNNGEINSELAGASVQPIDLTLDAIINTGLVDALV